ACVAVFLAAVGLYGVISYSVSSRTQEFGIRMALGAERANVLKIVGKEVLELTLAGVAMGIIAAMGLTRFLEGQLHGVSPTDPATFCVVSILLVSVAAVACYFPARRATRIDPLVALRYE
ncbi:MAG: FtsX-like permease family protein, partial [bacterium]|nr:FtsX-like permease family protein [bacterium]